MATLNLFGFCKDNRQTHKCHHKCRRRRDQRCCFASFNGRLYNYNDLAKEISKFMETVIRTQMTIIYVYCIINTGHMLEFNCACVSNNSYIIASTEGINVFRLVHLYDTFIT